MAAAVSDFEVKTQGGKLSRKSEQHLSLIPTEDIVAAYKEQNPDTYVLAFSAAESETDWIQTARDKKIQKGVEAVFANTEHAFESDSTTAVLIADSEVELSGTKDDVANRAVSHIANSLSINVK